jgi:hypothetical protein
MFNLHFFLLKFHFFGVFFSIVFPYVFRDSTNINHPFFPTESVPAGWGYAFEPFELTLAGDALEAEVKRQLGMGKLQAVCWENMLS